MAKDIEFALAVLKSDYKKRKDYLISDYKSLSPLRLGDCISELEDIKGAIIKIETTFKIM